MNALWAYFWPCFAAGLIAGGPVGTIAFRRRSKRYLALGLGLVGALLLAAAWHGPLGGGDRFAAKIEDKVHKTLVYYEMTQVTAHLHRDPLSRHVNLSGPADDFQRGDLVRVMNDIRGVSGTTWSSSGGTPLIVEGLAVSVLGFLFGLLLAYLVELRRRYNAQWNW